MLKSLIGVAAVAAMGSAFAVGVPASAYVQDGLVVQFDAIDNEGTGTHNPNATTWVDLKKSGASMPLRSGASWSEKWLDSTPNKQQIENMPEFRLRSVSTELTANVISNGPSGYWPRIFYHNGGDGVYSVYFSGTGSSPCLYINNKGTRPGFGTFHRGTLTVVSDATNARVFNTGVQGSSPVIVDDTTAKKYSWTLNGQSGYLHAYYRSLRHYNRGLTNAEVAYNALVDQVRFFPYEWKGESGGDWAAAANWEAPYGSAAGAPAKAENNGVSVVAATVAVTASTTVGALSLADGAKLDVAADRTFGAKLLFVDGVRIARGIYTGTGAAGTKVAWLAGEGQVQVADAADKSYPAYPTPAADGWYEYGRTDGATGYESNRFWIRADYPDWYGYLYPAGAKLRLVGHVIIDTIPDWFDEVDMSKVAYLQMHKSPMFADGRPVRLASGQNYRYEPGTWTFDAAKDRYGLKRDNSASDKNDIVLDGGTVLIHGDGEHLHEPCFDGDFSGTGLFKFGSYGNVARFRGKFGCDVSIGDGQIQNGSGLWLDTTHVSGRITKMFFSWCSDVHGTNVNFSASGLMFGKDNSDETADNELRIDWLDGRAGSVLDVPSGHRWRRGGHVIVWGGNTVHIGTLQDDLHIVGNRADQDCVSYYFNAQSYPCKGIGNVIIDRMSNAGTLYLSTNVNIKVGTVTANSVFDYTYQKDAINMMTFDITESCPEGAKVKATDLAMLPARLSGFPGTVNLTDTAAKTYPVKLDLSKGTNAVYNCGGCVGSGTLGTVPAAGAIDVTLTGTDAPARGAYGIARFTAGGEKLAGWTVTVNGKAESQFMVGTGANMKCATLMRDGSGIWLKVSNPGLTVILR